jgi:hypothetical protein
MLSNWLFTKPEALQWLLHSAHLTGKNKGYSVVACAIKVSMLRRGHYVDYIASNGMVTDELAGIWKEAVVAQTWNYAVDCLEEKRLSE